MLLFLGAVVAGVLTTLAPCVLPMLPVIVGGSLGPSSAQARRRAYVITASLGLSIVVFTLILKASTALIGIPSERVAVDQRRHPHRPRPGLARSPGSGTASPPRCGCRSGRPAGSPRPGKQQGMGGAVLTGAALGPVFSSCSPMYGYVIVTVLPASLAQGMAAAARLRHRPVRDAAGDRPAGPEVHRQRPLGGRSAPLVPAWPGHRVHPRRPRDHLRLRQGHPDVGHRELADRSVESRLRLHPDGVTDIA